MQIDQEKLDIIKDEGNVIVVSNPGTGKTTTLALKVIDLLENGSNPEEILCITFTEKAKKEMFDKIWDMAEGKLDKSDIMKVNIHTFHSFALDYLVERGISTGEIAGNNILRFSILKSFEANSALNYNKSYILSDIMPKTENAIRYIKSFGITPDKINTTSAENHIEKLYDSKKRQSLEELKAFLKYFVEAYKSYEDSKIEAIDYSDMLLVFLKNFSGEKYKHVLVDEMQDMNELEAEIVEKVGENLFLVGDSKQAIFGFQGGSTKNFEKFMKICNKHLLGKNRRSCRELLVYSREHFLNTTKNTDLFREELEKLDSEKNGEKPKIISTSSTFKKVADIINSHPDSHVGIITRTNKQLIELSDYLDKSRIQYSSTSSKATTKSARQEIIDFLKGILSQSADDKVKSAFTIFAPYTLKEAFEISRGHKFNKVNSMDKLDGMRRKFSINRASLKELFDKVVLPGSVSMGSEWFSTAVSVMGEIDEYFSFAKVPSYDDLFSFLSSVEESYKEKKEEAKVTLTTVHKAKGREFDVALYLPSSGQMRSSFIDTITEAILNSQGIDISEEIEEEALRVDFVAFTRAKEKLFVLADDRTSKKYFVENHSEIEVDTSTDEEIEVKMDSRLSQAYSLFLAGKFEESRKLIEENEKWLVKMIGDYFSDLERFSYSMINPDAYKFLINTIIAKPGDKEAMTFGSKVHSAVEEILEKKADLESFEGDVKLGAENAMKAIEELKKDFANISLDSTEKSMEVQLKKISDCDNEKLTFKGKTDAIFKHDGGYIIVDFKTDKNDSRSSEHRRQLAVYRKLLSLDKGIPEEKIKIAIIYVALRGGINTGKFDFKLDTKEPGKTALSTFENHLQKILGWKNNPQIFVKDVLEKAERDTLYQSIVEQINEEIKNI